MNNLVETEVDRLKKKIEEEMGKPEPDRSTVMECLQELRRLDADEEADKVLEAWEAVPQTKRGRATQAWRRIAAVAAVVAVLLLATVPQVLGAESVLTRIGSWTEKIFSFGEIREEPFIYKTNNSGLQELYDAVKALGVEENVVPTWLPDGYTLEQLSIEEKLDCVTVCASYANHEKTIAINYQVFVNLKSTEYQKVATDAVIYEKNGVTHYILSNNATTSAAWVLNNIECFISADTQEDICKIIASIYNTEE